MTFTITAQTATYQEIRWLRRLFLATFPAQVRYEVCHERGWSDYYQLKIENQAVGYGAVKGIEHLADRDAVFEFYLLPGYWQHATHFFRKLLETTNASYVECQTNEPLLTAMLYTFCYEIQEELWFLTDDHVTYHHVPGAKFRKRQDSETVPWQPGGPGDYLLLLGDKIAAEGGFSTHYNPPYADLHMSVAPTFQGRGIGAYFVQELKKTCYLSGLLPAARCLTDNPASLETLQKAGLKICGEMLWGVVKE